jgi:hypothetical protein
MSSFCIVNEGSPLKEGTLSFFGYILRSLKNLAIFTITKKAMDFFEVTGGRVLKRPTREPRN